MKKLFKLLAVLFSLAIAGIFLFVEDFEVSLTEAQVQSAIDNKISEGPTKYLGVELTLNQANVDFTADNKARINVNMDVDGLGFSTRISGVLGSGLRYESPNLYLSDLDYSELSFDMSTADSQSLSDLKSVAADFLRRQQEDGSNPNAPSETDYEAQAERYAREAVLWFFKSIPIYDLNDSGAAGSIASLALKDVLFTEDKAIVTLSPRLAVFKILIAIFTAIAFLIWMAIRIFGINSVAKFTVQTVSGSQAKVDLPEGSPPNVFKTIEDHTGKNRVEIIHCDDHRCFYREIRWVGNSEDGKWKNVSVSKKFQSADAAETAARENLSWLSRKR